MSDDKALDKLCEKLDFVRRRPQYFHHVGTLLATVSSCPDFGKIIPNFALEEAHEHVHGTGDADGCSYCQVNFEDAKGNQERIYNRSISE